MQNRTTDLEIPDRVWSRWTPSDGPRQLRRALSAEERAAVERRRDELAPVVAPYAERDVDRVALALADMFGGFSSMRQTGDEVVARIDGARRVLSPYPAWAIEKACAAIQSRGVFREGKFDRRWPPSDAEVGEVVREELRLYGDAHGRAIALLSATVER